MGFKKISFIFCLILIVMIPLFSLFFRDGLLLDMAGIHLDRFSTKKIIIKNEYSQVDTNQNSVADPLDIVLAARKEVENRTEYKSAYYEGGYPPASEGVCTDVIWRGLAGAGIQLKDLMDKDISEHTSLYPRVEGNPDPHIDFRRVPNQDVFFQRFTESLTTEFIPDDPENLAEWQPGDIVIFLEGIDHAGIISDKRTRDGIPYFIHNIPPYASEIKLTSYKQPIAGHYRWKY